MSLRQLPTLDVERPRDAAFDIPPKALSRWDATVQAASASDAATISILDPIGFDPWTGEGVTAKRIQAELRAIGDKPVTVQVNSPGGDYFEGLAIYQLLAQHKAEVTVQVLGLAGSAASVITMAGDRIEMARAAIQFVHNTQWIAVGDRHMMRDTADAMEKFDRGANALYAARTGQPDADIAAMMDAETFLGADEAIELGFADAVMAEEPKRDNKAKQAFAFRVESVMARAGVPRAERRKLTREIFEAMPGADLRTAMPSAGDPPDRAAFLADLRSFNP